MARAAIGRANAPERVTVEVFDWSHDVNGNPTARFLIMWGRGQGKDWRGGRVRPKRRRQVGYGDKISEGAMAFLSEYWPGTVWRIVPGTMTGGRHSGGATFEAERDFEAEPVPVIFRRDPQDGSLCAFFPTLPGTGPGDVMVYARNGEPGTATREYYDTTRPAKGAEVDDLARHLAGRGYVLSICQRWTAAHGEERRAGWEAQRARAAQLQEESESNA